jgi:hypothetical protein
VQLHNPTIDPSLRAIPGVQYLLAKGVLFHHGIKVTDPNEGGIGDCYFVAAMAAVAHMRPELIKRALSPNDDGSVTVHLFMRNKALSMPGRPVIEERSVTVDRTLPTYVGTEPNGPPPDADGMRLLYVCEPSRRLRTPSGRIVGAWDGAHYGEAEPDRAPRSEARGRDLRFDQGGEPRG